MTAAERLVLLLVADLALMTDGYTPLHLIEATRIRLREARCQLDAEAFRELTREPAE
jgi:hypothetical protein